MNHKARKRFGQNFLKDHNVIFNILANIQAQPKDHWVEIGPGLGAITKPLLEKKVLLDVVELDRDLVQFLKNKFNEEKNFTIHSSDALKFDFTALANKDEKLRIIGNLPYNISTPLLFHLLESSYCIEDMHFMLQKEVVDRITAQPGSKTYGRLSVMVQYHCNTEYLFYVGPEAFSPPPKVDSAVLRLQPWQQKPYLANDLKLLSQVVTQAFSMRRKTLRNTLKKLLTVEQIKRAGVDPTLRPENLSVKHYVDLSNLL